jgi:hypothetical protein
MYERANTLSDQRCSSTIYVWGTGISLVWKLVGNKCLIMCTKVYEAYPDKKNYYLLKVASKNLMQINTSFGLTFTREDMEKQ